MLWTKPQIPKLLIYFNPCLGHKQPQPIAERDSADDHFRQVRLDEVQHALIHLDPHAGVIVVMLWLYHIYTYTKIYQAELRIASSKRSDCIVQSIDAPAPACSELEFL